MCGPGGNGKRQHIWSLWNGHSCPKACGGMGGMGGLHIRDWRRFPLLAAALALALALTLMLVLTFVGEKEKATVTCTLDGIRPQ